MARPTLSINARVCEDYVRVAQQARDAGWEFMGHSYEQGPIHKEADQAAMIARSMGILETFTGKRPVGWLGPGLTQTYETPELLAAAGVKYIGDWVYDDEPTTIRTANGPLVTLPYTVELKDFTGDKTGKDEESGSPSYVAKDADKDTQLQYALNFLHGTAKGPEAANNTPPSSATPTPPSSGNSGTTTPTPPDDKKPTPN